MNISVINEDQIVTIDGKSEHFELNLDGNIWAIQWDGSTGEVEYKDSTPNKIINSFSNFDYLVTKYDKTKSDAEKAEAEAYTERTYKVNRKIEYPDSADYLDGIVKGDTAQVDKYISDCLAVKAKYPKP